MRGSNDEDEPSGVVMVGWALFLSVVVVAMALIVSASIETALAPPMSPSAPGEVQLTAFETWIVVAILLAVPFFFLRASIRDPRELNALDRAMMRISAPIQYVSSLLAREVSNLWGNYVYLVEVKADHQRLVYENARLMDRVRRLEQDEVENRRLKRLLGLKEAIPGDLVNDESAIPGSLTRTRSVGGDAFLCRDTGLEACDDA